jgi:hypothetical protein
MESEPNQYATLEQIARNAASALLRSARRVDYLFTSGSLENARTGVVDAARRRAIKDALDSEGGPDLGRTA